MGKSASASSGGGACACPRLLSSRLSACDIPPPIPSCTRGAARGAGVIDPGLGAERWAVPTLQNRNEERWAVPTLQNGIQNVNPMADMESRT